jgi:hypothetical protein
MICQEMQDAGDLAGLFRSPRKVEKLLVGAKGNSTQYSHPLGNLIRDADQAPVLGKIKGVKFEKTGSANVPMGAACFVDSMASLASVALRISIIEWRALVSSPMLD